MKTTNTIDVLVNGATHSLSAEHAKLEDLLSSLDIDAQTGGVAVAVDGEVIPRHRWHQHGLDGGERIEIIRAVQGG